MGKNNPTHFEGQVLTFCPGCDRSIRMLPGEEITMVVCGSCGDKFRASREDGEVIE